MLHLILRWDDFPRYPGLCISTFLIQYFVGNDDAVGCPFLLEHDVRAKPHFDDLFSDFEVFVLLVCRIQVLFSSHILHEYVGDIWIEGSCSDPSEGGPRIGEEGHTNYTPA